MLIPDHCFADLNVPDYLLDVTPDEVIRLARPESPSSYTPALQRPDFGWRTADVERLEEVFPGWLFWLEAQPGADYVTLSMNLNTKAQFVPFQLSLPADLAARMSRQIFPDEWGVAERRAQSC